MSAYGNILLEVIIISILSFLIMIYLFFVFLFQGRIPEGRALADLTEVQNLYTKFHDL